MRLFQNFSFWKSLLRFKGKTGLLSGFSKAISKTNRVLEMAHIIKCIEERLKTVCVFYANV